VSTVPGGIVMAGAAAARARGGQVSAIRLGEATTPERAPPLEAMGLVPGTALARPMVETRWR
jgi:hypothetical protein